MDDCLGILIRKTPSFIDHLVPLCSITKCPLICTEEEIALQIEHFYPFQEVECIPLENMEERLKKARFLLYVDHYKMPHGGFQFPGLPLQLRAKSICSLHGNSDKKRSAFWIERFQDEDVVLLYGDHMIDFLSEKGAFERCKKVICSGNYRLAYYKAHRDFFNEKIEHFLFPKGSSKTILYAPTWTSPARTSEWKKDFSPFFETHEKVFLSLPEDMQVYVKLHPYMSEFYPNEIAHIKEKYEGNGKIKFITDCPLIYPFLEKVDYYLGDYSSIGYDFLFYNRPLFFLNVQAGGPLEKCGTVIQDISEISQKEDTFAEKRIETYNYAFGEEVSLESLSKQLEEAIACG